MKPSEIISADSKKRKLDPKTVLNGVNVLLKKGAILLHQDKTALLVIPIGNGTAELRIFTEDAPIKLAKSMFYFYNKLQKSDLKTLYIKEDENNIVELMQKIDIPVEQSDNPQYQYMVNL